MAEERLADLQPLRQLLTGGDLLSPRHVARVLRRLPGCKLINGYGPTENTTFTCCHAISREEDGSRPISIGRPIANTRVYALDRHLQPVPVGVPGELCAAGDGVARGYLTDPTGTAERFVSDPFSTAPGTRMYRTGDLVSYNADGTLNFLGRLDRQVKIRGFRVELEEIEAALLDCPGIKEAAVVVRDVADGDRQLVGYVVAESATERATENWRAHLSKRLPDYMLPVAWVKLDRFPLSPNGKIDRAALPPSVVAEKCSPEVTAAPVNLLEFELLRIWQRLFGRSDIGRRDNFFDLGGHSLMAARLATQVERLLGHRMPLASIFQAPTVESLTRMLRDADWLPAWTSLVPLQPHGAKPSLFFVHGWGGDVFTFVNLARMLGPDQPVYGLQAVGLDGRQPRHTSVEAMARHYVEEIRSFQPNGPYYLCAYSLGGWIAWEIAQQLHLAGQRIGLLALLDTHATCRLPFVLQVRMLGSRLLVRFGFHVRRLFTLPPREWPGYAAGRFAALRFLLWRTRPPAPSSAADSADPAFPGTAHAGDHYCELTFRYRPSCYAGAVDWFCSEHSSPKALIALKRLARAGVRQHLVAGDHHTLLDEEHVNGFAATFRQALLNAQEQARRPSE
jgi:pimeloyl-ACP methyl ester carboxylesterase/acyl carrier protein